MWTCKHCIQSFINFSTSQKANHSRWCLSNPKREQYVEQLIKNNNVPLMNSARTLNPTLHNQYTKAKSNGVILVSPLKGRPGIKRPHTEETKRLLSEKALASNHRRIIRSTRTYVCKDGTLVLLDSSWEEALAVRLDYLDISWIRPGPIPWVDFNGKTHNYFPDFYLPDHDIYLDPKNDIVYNLTIEKINCITKILPNLKILRSLEECNTFNV